MDKHWQASYSYNDFSIISENKPYSGHFDIVIRNLKFKLFSGENSPIVRREMMLRNPAVVVLLYHPKEDAVLLTEQFRPGAIDPELNTPWLLEPVAGLIENGDHPEATAKREAFEETGTKVLELIPICKYLASPGMTNELVHIYCGKIDTCDLASFHGLESESEDIKSHLIPVSQAFELLENNTILAASGIIALQWLKINLDKVRNLWQK